MEIPMTVLAKLDDPEKLEVIRVINKVDNGIPRTTEERAIKMLLRVVKEGHCEKKLIKLVA